MTLDRRRLLGLSAIAGLTSFTPPFLVQAGATTKSVVDDAAPQAALLLPLTGASADLAASMARAAALAQPSGQKEDDFLVLDTGDTSEGAGLAAERAVSAGTGLILGPLFAAQVAAVVTAASGRPVLTFSNDASLGGSGAFVLGLTAFQGVAAILAYARSRGVRRVAVVTSPDSWSRQSIDAARLVSKRLGVAIFEIDAERAAAAGDLNGALAQVCQGTAPDAVLFSQSKEQAALLSAKVMETGIQILGPPQWVDAPSDFLASVDGAWIAAPDPSDFAPFARSYEARHSSAPGLLAGLAFDGAGIVRRLRAADRVSRDGLLAQDGFQGALGSVRFAQGGDCTRVMAIQVAGNRALRTVGSATGG